MRFSHSKLNLVLSDPMSYYLRYEQGIRTKERKKALLLGSAVHWGIEHDTDDLTEYFKEEGVYDYTNDQALAEGMVYGYFKHKDELFDKLLNDYEGNKLELLSEQHEVEFFEPLKSYAYSEPHEFQGIIDLLLITEKGFILVDYKTSTYEPDWDKYLDQLYRYIFELNSAYPDVPVYKIAIINLRKKNLKKKLSETDEQFRDRFRREYELNTDDLINYHEFNPEELDRNKLALYIDNLSRTCDFAKHIIDNKMYFINYNNAVSVYGKSDYYEIFYQENDCEFLYEIKDVYIDENGEQQEYRDCRKIDMRVIFPDERDKIINHYDKYKTALYWFYNGQDQLEILLHHPEVPKDKLKNDIKQLFKESEMYITDDYLLDMYFNNLQNNL